jgi:hypothetical protein
MFMHEYTHAACFTESKTMCHNFIVLLSASKHESTPNISRADSITDVAHDFASRETRNQEKKTECYTIQIRHLYETPLFIKNT